MNAISPPSLKHEPLRFSAQDSRRQRRTHRLIYDRLMSSQWLEKTTFRAPRHLTSRGGSGGSGKLLRAEAIEWNEKSRLGNPLRKVRPPTAAAVGSASAAAKRCTFPPAVRGKPLLPAVRERPPARSRPRPGEEVPQSDEEKHLTTCYSSPACLKRD